MEKINKVDRVLSGQEVDCPPVSLWYHFGVQHGSGKQFANITLEQFEYYDFDFLKVMNDIFYPPPVGLKAVASEDDLHRIGPLDIESVWKQQFIALDRISTELKGRAYFIDTVFDPWQSIRRAMAGEHIQALMQSAPDALLDALEVVTDNLIHYCKQSLKIGSAGIFLSVAAGAEILTRQEFLTFVKPFATRLLEAVADRAKMNTVHVHGETLFFDDAIDFPAAIFSWWDRGPKGPSLQWVKERISGCVMGGIDQTIVSRRTPAFLKQHAAEGIGMGGRTRFLLAGGCTIDSWVYPESIHSIVAAAREGC
ncbi:MAG: hypothetical protein AMJ54_04890 [Deltaproteobacteria bacterium SG8_13]|nr:MAG: hypothetical protein AMJ54_04890 [Deltaproteobacteria bacterium SG8_13]